MRKKLISVAMLGVIAASTAGQAATLDVKGGVQVNIGQQGFRAGTLAENLPIGTQVMAAPGGEARVYYNENCFVRVKPGQVYTVGPKAPCNANDAAQSAENPPEPGNLTGTLTSPTAPVEPGGLAGLSATDAALGAGALAAAIAAGIYFANQNNSSP